ncbi:MAG: hypothetical protein ACUVRR_03675 [Candidatus Fervidibacter sp.]|uniref:hypothetical protein n=1 Tax=Candidatus Fervidibacter sp. TaxID=3100871 RepID=UPI00404B9504
MNATVDGDIFAGGLWEGNVFLLCSDGLTSHVQDEELKRHLQATTSLQESCRQLAALANERGGHDNITILLSQVGTRQPMQRLAPMRQADIPTQPYLPRPAIRRRKRHSHWQFLALPLLLSVVLIGMPVGIYAWMQRHEKRKRP